MIVQKNLKDLNVLKQVTKIISKKYESLNAVINFELFYNFRIFILLLTFFEKVIVENIVIGSKTQLHISSLAHFITLKIMVA